MATSGRDRSRAQAPNGINGGATPERSERGASAVYAGLVLELCCGLGWPIADQSS